MKYEFEVNCHENENVIKVTVGFGSMANSVTRTIKFEGGTDYDVPTLDELLLDMVDNIRLTVKEREEAMYNVNAFKWYLKQYGTDRRDPKKESQMIVERDNNISLLNY